VIVDFDRTRAELETSSSVEPELLWHIRARLGDRRRQSSAFVLNARQLGWLIASFRDAYRYSQRPHTVTTGDTNPWDATGILFGAHKTTGRYRRPLKPPPSCASCETLQVMNTASCCELPRLSNAEKRLEENWTAPDLKTIMAAISDLPPTTPAQLQVVILDTLCQVQAQLVGSDVDWYVDFLRKDGSPRIRGRVSRYHHKDDAPAAVRDPGLFPRAISATTSAVTFCANRET
jgi:hypothetical protein